MFEEHGFDELEDDVLFFAARLQRPEWIACGGGWRVGPESESDRVGEPLCREGSVCGELSGRFDGGCYPVPIGSTAVTNSKGELGFVPSKYCNDGPSKCVVTGREVGSDALQVFAAEKLSESVLAIAESRLPSMGFFGVRR